MATDRGPSSQHTAYLASGGNFCSTARPFIGGYDVEFVSALPQDYVCPICQLACRDPVQTTECGHRFCESCLEPILRSGICFLFHNRFLGILDVFVFHSFLFYFRKNGSFCPLDRRPLTREKVCWQFVRVVLTEDTIEWIWIDIFWFVWIFAILSNIIGTKLYFSVYISSICKVCLGNV